MGCGLKCFILMKLFPEIREKEREKLQLLMSYTPSLVFLYLSQP